MIKINNYDECIISDRNGTYGGAAGSKEGIIIDNEYWMIKYPQRTNSMNNVAISYTTAPLSEFVGSHIYEILGYDTHETELGIRNNKLVVACKDFCSNGAMLREIRTIKNVYNKDIEEELAVSLHPTGDSHSIDIDELKIHLTYNPILKNVPGIKERFWECSIVDILINNNDRNNGNWGLLYKDGINKLAPVYDNGASFSNKMSVSEMEKCCKDESIIKQKAMSVRTTYSKEGKVLFAKKFLSLDNTEIKKAVLKLTPIIHRKLPDIKDFIYEIPSKVGDFDIMPKAQKEYYMKCLDANYEYLIEPRYREIINEKHITSQKNHKQPEIEEEL